MKNEWLVAKLFWYFQGKENWEMKMNQPPCARDLTPEELRTFKETGKI